MARAAWPWTLVVLLAAFLAAATVATAALMLLVRRLSRLGRSARTNPAPDAVRLENDGLGANGQPSRSPDGNEQGEASPRRRTTRWWPHP